MKLSCKSHSLELVHTLTCIFPGMLHYMTYWSWVNSSDSKSFTHCSKSYFTTSNLGYRHDLFRMQYCEYSFQHWCCRTVNISPNIFEAYLCGCNCFPLWKYRCYEHLKMSLKTLASNISDLDQRSHQCWYLQMPPCYCQLKQANIWRISGSSKSLMKWYLMFLS